ncbi:hypothetical protein [Amnibacterium kyonggiense]|uniref:Phospholipase D-like protein n=1 Tax=Amnibacterium kyonggiense TaxID=595671 RepID=A0A4R7FKH8_9MICO|nr:hypothetical protein [Amnibacterium kyonggiense]TDS76881.1 hypothetical protein CLV52_1820 [Amnibacterium kyonggiense]
MTRRVHWQDLNPRRRAAIVVGAAAELALTATAAVRLVRTPAERLRGSRAAWIGLLVVQPIGPVLVLALARRR